MGGKSIEILNFAGKMGVEFAKSNQIRNRERKHEVHENGLVMLGIKNIEYQYVSMLMHSIWWLGFMMFHCGLEMLQLVDVKDPYLR